jgi:hypothetical protein
MANLAYIDDSNLCKNNYYHALATEYVPNPPPTTPAHHTGIANSGASGFYFAPDTLVTNYNPKAPTVGVRVANGRPKRSVASATLALASSLPPAAMLGHVMPSFPHILIGLGPFANQGCNIVFTKTSVTVYHPDGHPILSGWRDETGLRLWHFPLTAEASNPQDASTATVPQPPSPAPPLLSPPASIVMPWPLPAPVINPLPVHPHPSQSILATSTSGAACLVYYLNGAAQAVALAAHAAGTLFDPRSLDLPSIAALAGFDHACLGFPVKQTWLNAIKAGNCDTFEGLTYSNAAKYCPDSDKTIMGHLAQQRQNVRSTKPKLPTPAPLVVRPAPVATPSNQVFIMRQLLSKLYTNNTGRFPIRACSGNQYVMIAFHANGNLILQQAFKTKSDCHCIAAYNAIMTCLAAQGLSVDLQIFDNEASSAYKEAIIFKWNATFQLVPPNMHRCNQAERAICTFKNHFLAILAGIDAAFLPYLWDLLLPQAELDLNLLRQATLNPRISAGEFFQGPYDFNKMPLGPVGCRVLIHAKPATRHSWDFCAKNGFYIGPAMESYRCFKLVNADTKCQVISDTVPFLPFRPGTVHRG